MVTKSHGKRARTRKKLSKSKREKFKVTKYLKAFEVGSYVAVVIDPSSHKGMPHPRFHGLTGRILGKRGNAYIVEVRDGNKRKQIFARPEHLKEVRVM